MPLIQFSNQDLLVSRATPLFLELAHFDTCDLSGEFQKERFSIYAKLHFLENEAARLGENWQEIYDRVFWEVETYDSGKSEEEWYPEN